MQSKIIIALRRHYHCEHARTVMQQNALPYPVYEIDEKDISLSILRRAVKQGAEILITGDVYAESIMKQLDISVVTIRRNKISFSDSIRNALKIADRAAIVWRDSDSPAVKKPAVTTPVPSPFFRTRTAAILIPFLTGFMNWSTV